jgi:hypothetical protein
VNKAIETLSIRYTSDSHGQGVHEGHPVANEPFSWGEVGRPQHSSQHFALGGAPTHEPGGSNYSRRCIECSLDWIKSQTRYSSFGVCLAVSLESFTLTMKTRPSDR